MDFMFLYCIWAEQLVWIQVTEAKKKGFINIVITEILTNLKNKLISHYIYTFSSYLTESASYFCQK